MEIVTSWNRLKQYGCASAGEAMSETYPDSLKATKAQTIVFFIEGAPSTLHTILRGGGTSGPLAVPLSDIDISVQRTSECWSSTKHLGQHDPDLVQASTCGQLDRRSQWYEPVVKPDTAIHILLIHPRHPTAKTMWRALVCTKRCVFVFTCAVHGLPAGFPVSFVHSCLWHLRHAVMACCHTFDNMPCGEGTRI